MNYQNILGKKVHVIIDRKIHTVHPEHSDIHYECNYGYVEGIEGGDGEEQDVYILGIDYPISEFNGKVVAVIHRLDDNEDKWIVTKNGKKFTKEEIKQKTNFQEKYFSSVIYL